MLPVQNSCRSDWCRNLIFWLEFNIRHVLRTSELFMETKHVYIFRRKLFEFIIITICKMNKTWFRELNCSIAMGRCWTIARFIQVTHWLKWITKIGIYIYKNWWAIDYSKSCVLLHVIVVVSNLLIILKL